VFLAPCKGMKADRIKQMPKGTAPRKKKDVVAQVGKEMPDCWGKANGGGDGGGTAGKRGGLTGGRDSCIARA